MHSKIIVAKSRCFDSKIVQNWWKYCKYIEFSPSILEGGEEKMQRIFVTKIKVVDKYSLKGPIEILVFGTG